MEDICVVCVCAVCMCERAGFRNDERNRIYTSGRENSLLKGFPRLRVFVAPLTFRRFALGSAEAAPGSGTSLALDPDREGASGSVAATLSGTRGGEGGGASSSSSSEDPVGS